MNTAILAPAVALVLWTLVMLGWMAAVRMPALKSAGVRFDGPGGRRGQDLEGVIDDRINWKAHNYAHLHEQPTLFYAIVAVLAIAGAANDFDIALAWLYVAFRVVHSLVQATSNKVAIRLPLFLISSTMLLILAIDALRATI